MLSSHLDYEKHIKLYFVRNRTRTTTNANSVGHDSPYCAHHMANILEKLRNKGRYIVFAHDLVVSSRLTNIVRSSVPSYHSFSAESSNHKSNMEQHQHHQRHPHSSSVRNASKGHHLISLIAYSLPEVLNRNTSRLVRKTTCKNNCAKPASVHSNTVNLHVATRGNITLACRIDGNPLPWIEWYRNGKRLRTRPGKRVFITQKKRVSHLTIVRASHRRDSGIYKCQAMNVASKQPAVKYFQVFVNNRNHRKNRPSLSVQSSSTISKNNKNDENIDHDPLSVQLSNNADDQLSNNVSPYGRSNSDNYFGEERTMKCPLSEFCLNGSKCFLYESLGEYVCQCADGYRGRRCEFKDINMYPAQKALLDYDLNTRMLHSYRVSDRM
ncbi:negative regulator of glucose-controlled proteins [Blomia tropicalis]|nr:negative regulator of glucose-controlled proteins [Blomia tropicalis]